MFGMRKKELPSIERGENPYLNAQDIWFEQYGRYIVAAARWRFIAFLSLIICLLSLVGNIIQMNQDKIVRYFVAMDELGKTVTDKINAVANNTPQRIIQAVIAESITNWRTVTVDKSLQQNMIDNLAAHVGGAAKGHLAQWYSNNSPYDIAYKGQLVSVQIKNVPLPVSDNSYRVEWTEVIRDINGQELGRYNYQAILTVEISNPQTEEMVLKNPGGVYITSISTSKILE